MSLRKRRQPTPGFRIPPPYNPFSGKHSPVKLEGIQPYCALMQVAAEDTEDDYVICRGYDPRIDRYIDYESGNADKPGIPVAKPYGTRDSDQYVVGEMHAAFLPVCRLGQTPGVAATSSGHPADLDEEVEILYTTSGQVINWMFIWNKPTAETLKPMCYFTFDEALTTSDQTATATIQTQWGHGKDHSSTAITVYNLPTSGAGYEFEADSGDYGIASYSGTGTNWHIIIPECP